MLCYEQLTLMLTKTKNLFKTKLKWKRGNCMNSQRIVPPSFLPKYLVVLTSMKESSYEKSPP